MRRITELVCAIVIAALALSGCRPIVSDEEKTLSIYATFYPIYALTDALTDGVPNVQLHCLVQPQDGCLRSYALSDWDAALLSGADAVIAGGRGLEAFESTLFGWGERGPAVSAILYNLELNNRSRSHSGGEEDSHWDGPNPHLYMSIDGAARMIDSIAAQLMTLDPAYARQYADNAERADSALAVLLEQARAIVGDASGQPVILMNEALVYVARDYDLTVETVIERESSQAYYDTELKDCLDRLSGCASKVVLIEKQAPASLVDALRDAGYSVALIDIMSTHREGEGFEVYCQTQLENARAIDTAIKGAKGQP